MNLNLKYEEPGYTGTKQDKVVFVDADSLAFMVSYPGKDENGEARPDYTEEDYEYVEGKLNELVLSILNRIEERYNITDYYLCVRGKNNFRKEIFPEYKANRIATPPIVSHLCQYLLDNYKCIEAHGYEADDMVFTLSERIGHTGVIACMDKDLYQIPSIFYNYFKDEWSTVSDTQAKYNLAIQVLTGDAGDNVKVNRGLGPVKAAAIVHPDMTDYQYIKAIYKAYIQYNGSQAKEKLKLVYKLLKLHNVLV